MRPEQVYKCRVQPCQNVKGQSNHWFVALIDKDRRLVVEKFDRQSRFEQAARRHGAIEICSEKCLHVHLSRWAGGKITAADAPECGSPAVKTPGSLTAWVSMVYKTHTSSSRFPGIGQISARIIVYRDDGREAQIWCFNEPAFERIEATAGSHAKFRTQSRGDYDVVVDVIEVLDSPILKGEKHVNSATSAV